jgi:DNA-binding response OmpR family regulator
MNAPDLDLNAPPPASLRYRATLLVVDDDPGNLAVIGAALEPLGHHLEFASSAAEAERIAARRAPDLVLLDVAMPGESGIDLCRRWRRAEHMNGTPVVLVTALGAASHRTEGLRAGADDYLEKPLDIEALIDRVASWIARGTSGPRPARRPAALHCAAGRVAAAAAEIAPGDPQRALAVAMAHAAGLDDVAARFADGGPDALRVAGAGS